MAQAPQSSLARATLPAPLYQALTHLFAQGVTGSMLVGGTALAGYYAGHRRSDDLDLFVADASAFRALVLAVESLAGIGCHLSVRQRTPQFFDVTTALQGHAFTIQVVLDARLFEVGSAQRADDQVLVASLETLLKQKSATLISRCSEKDLYDLRWLLAEFHTLTVADLLQMGAEIDAGMTAENVMLSLTGATLRESACGFAPSLPAAEILRLVTELRDNLAIAFDKLARRQPLGPVGELVRTLGTHRP